MPDDTKTQIPSELVAIRDELRQIRELLAWARLDLAETIRAASAIEFEIAPVPPRDKPQDRKAPSISPM